MNKMRSCRRIKSSIEDNHIVFLGLGDEEIFKNTNLKMIQSEQPIKY